MTEELKTHYEVVINLKQFKIHFPDHVLEEMAKALSVEVIGEVREVAD